MIDIQSITQIKNCKFTDSFADDKERLIHLQHGEEGRLRHLDIADLAHTLFTALLFFEQFALAGDVAAVALRRHILAHRLHRLAGNDLGPDGRLYRNVELLARDQLLEPKPS